MSQNVPVSCVPAIKDPHRHEEFLARIRQGPVGLLFVGDSITDAWRGGVPFQIFQKHWGKYQPGNFGIGGDQTSHVLWRLTNGELDGISPKLIVLMIGTNNLGNDRHTAADTAEGIKAVVRTMREKLPQTKVLLLAVFPRGQQPGDAFRGWIKTVNNEVAKLDDGKNIKYLDIGPKFLEADGSISPDTMPDFLHLTERAYQIWADAISPTVDAMMK